MSKRISARDAAAGHRWRIGPRGRPDVHRAHRERVRGQCSEAFQRQDRTRGRGACALLHPHQPRAAVHVRRAGPRQGTRGPGGGWTYGPAREIPEGSAGHRHVGSTDTPVGASSPGAIWPGLHFEFKVTAKPGERLTIAAMFVQSNDLFYAPREEGIALFDAGGKPIGGDVTSQILLWDAGTEVNEEPGLGPNQAPLQPAPNTGPAEHGVVRPITEVKDGFHYPTVPAVLRVTITPGPMAAH